MRARTATAVIVLVVSSAAHGLTPSAGSIAGTVKLTGRVRGAAVASAVYQPRAIGGREAARAPEITHVIVYLRGVPARGTPPAGRYEIRQEHEAFVPRVLAVTRGSQVHFPNLDPFFHNVFSLSGAATFDLGRYPQGEDRVREFTRAGLVKVFCHIHSHMSASILVLDHPYFTVPDADGRFRLTNVPPGRHTIVGWHERVGEQAAHVNVVGGAVASIELSVPIEDDP
jgi:plastocyanin